MSQLMVLLAWMLFGLLRGKRILRLSILMIMAAPMAAHPGYASWASRNLPTDAEVVAIIRSVPVHHANVPTLIQATNSALEPSSWPNLIYRLPHPTLSGNCLILYVQTGATSTFTITDDGSGNAWTQQQHIDSSQFLYVYTCPNVSASTQKITVTFGASQAAINGGVAEFNNVATSSPLDTSGTNSGTGDAATVAMTTGTAGDLLFMVAIQQSFTALTTLSSPGMSADASSTLLHTDLIGGTASAIQVQAASGAVTMTINGFIAGTSWCSVGIAVKSASAGSPIPATIRIRRRQFSSYNSTSKVLFVVQLPITSGNLAVYSLHSWNADTADHSVASLIDQGSNNFFFGAGANHFNSGGTNRTDESIWYSPNASSVTPIATVTTANVCQEFTAALYEIVGQNQNAPLGATSATTGSAAVSPFNAGSITPNQANSMVIVNLPIETSSVSGSTAPTSLMFDGFFCTGMDGGFNILEEDNGHGHYLTPNTSAITFTWTSTTAAGNWAAVIAEFLPPAPPPVAYGSAFQITRRPGRTHPGVPR